MRCAIWICVVSFENIHRSPFLGGLSEDVRLIGRDLEL